MCRSQCRSHTCQRASSSFAMATRRPPRLPRTHRRHLDRERGCRGKRRLPRQRHGFDVILRNGRAGSLAGTGQRSPREAPPPSQRRGWGDAVHGQGMSRSSLRGLRRRMRAVGWGSGCRCLSHPRGWWQRAVGPRGPRAASAQSDSSSSSCSKRSPDSRRAGKGSARESGGVKASRAWQRTVTAAEGQEEEVVPSAGASTHKHEPGAPESLGGHGHNQGRMGPPPVHICPHRMPLSAVPLLASHSQRGLERLGRSEGLSYPSLDAAAASASTEEPGEVREGHAMPGQMGRRINAFETLQPRVLVSSRQGAGPLLAAPAEPPRPPPVTAVSPAEPRSYSR